jgi:hypothetical protein
VLLIVGVHSPEKSLQAHGLGQSPEEKRAQSACDELIDKGAIITGE